jgi:hypothetical protein
MDDERGPFVFLKKVGIGKKKKKKMSMSPD